MTWPTPWVPRDPDDVIEARRQALIDENTERLRAAAEHRARLAEDRRRRGELTAARHAAARAALIEDVEWLWPSETPREIVMHLGYSAAALARRLRRAGRADLALPFERIEAEYKRDRARQRVAA